MTNKCQVEIKFIRKKVSTVGVEDDSAADQLAQQVQHVQEANDQCWERKNRRGGLRFIVVVIRASCDATGCGGGVISRIDRTQGNCRQVTNLYLPCVVK
jgi:hypothetical protein